MKPSKITLIFASFIFISASFMRQVMNLLLDIIGYPGIAVLLWVLFIILAALSFRTVIKGPRLLLLPILLSALIYISQMHIIEERLHIMKYGVLGWLALRDIIGNKRVLVSVVFSFFFCLLVSSIDETFQYFLPYRVGEVRDVGLAALGSAFGIGVYLVNLYNRLK